MDRIEALRAVVEKYKSPDPSTLAKLPKPTKRENAPGRCDVCKGWHGLPAVHIDYMGHADVTLALLDVDPEWTWEPAAMNESGPVITKESNRLVMWGYLSVLGLRRLCVGTCGATQPDAEKELIGDLLRNGAMRFGIGTNLWSKSEASELAGHDDGPASRARPAAARKAAAPLAVVPAARPPDRVDATTGEITATRDLATDKQIQKLVMLIANYEPAMAKDSDRALFTPEPKTATELRRLVRLRWLGEFVGHPIDSSKELTRVEAGKVIDHLEPDDRRDVVHTVQHPHRDEL